MPTSSCNPATGPEGLRRRVERGVECGVFSAALACTEPTPRPIAATSVAAAELALQKGATAINPPPMSPGFAEDSLTPPGRGIRLDRRVSPEGRQSGAEDTALETGPAARTGSPPRAWTVLGSKMWVMTSPTGVDLWGTPFSGVLHLRPGDAVATAHTSSFVLDGTSASRPQATVWNPLPLQSIRLTVERRHPPPPP